MPKPITAGLRWPQGGGCSIQVTFTPTAGGDRPGTLTVRANTQAGVLTATLDGTGLTPGALALSPASLSFPTTATGASAPAESVTLQNTGGSALTLGARSIVGADTNDFSLPSGSNCPSSLAAGASCSVQVVFNPVQTGTRTAQLQVVASAQGSPFLVNLSGGAVLPAFLAPSPTSLSFASTPQGRDIRHANHHDHGHWRDHGAAGDGQRLRRLHPLEQHLRLGAESCGLLLGHDCVSAAGHGQPGPGSLRCPRRMFRRAR